MNEKVWFNMGDVFIKVEGASAKSIIEDGIYNIELKRVRCSCFYETKQNVLDQKNLEREINTVHERLVNKTQKLQSEKA
jgi:hypothetical protein